MTKPIDLSVPWPMLAITSRGKSPDELVGHLEHPNYWVRCMAAGEMRDTAKKTTDEDAAAALVALLAAPAASGDDDVQRWASFVVEALPGRRAQAAAGTECTTCHRTAPSGDACLLSAFTVNANDDYTMFVGCSNPFISPGAIPTPPRNPLDASEWQTVLQSTRHEWIQVAKMNMKQQGPTWNPAWLVCSSCARVLGVSGDDLASAKEAGRKSVAGEKVEGVMTEAGRKLLAQVNSNCFVCTVAFGDADAPEVVTLRLFRDQWLVRRKWGIAVVAVYERVGPHAAAMVKRRPWLRSPLRPVLRRVARYVQQRLGTEGPLRRQP